MTLRHLIPTCAAMLVCVAAHAGTVTVGYSHGEVSAEGQSRVGSTPVSAAIVLTPDMLAPYAGATIAGVRVGLADPAATTATDYRAWVSATLDGDPLASASLAAPAAGWNEVMFADAALTVTADMQLAVGYTFSQEKSAKVMATGGPENAQGAWSGKDGKWDDYSKRYRASYAIELILTSPDLPDTNLSVRPSETRIPVFDNGEAHTFAFVVENMAQTPVAGFTYQWSIAGTSLTGEGSVSETLQYQGTHTLEVDIPADALPAARLQTLSMAIAADGDERADDNSVDLPFSTYDEALQRHLLFEEFTTEECPNCPRAASSIHAILDDPDLGHRVHVVSHHVGYGTDWLTVEADKDYMWFYSDLDGGTFAPGGMFDRRRDPVENAHNSGVVESIGYISTVKPRVEKALAIPTFVTIEPSSNVDLAGKRVTADIKIERMPIFADACPEARLTAFLVEHDILAIAQAGGSSDFRHHAVNRLCLTGTWGDVIEWNGDLADVRLSADLPAGADTWVADNLELVVFVHEYDPTDYNNCPVWNTAIALPVGAGIDTPAADAAPVAIYDLRGMSVTHTHPGNLYIERRADGTARKYLAR